MADRDILADAKEAFKLVYDAESEQRKRVLEDLRFARLGEQWPSQVRRQREIDGRPCLTLNRMPAFCKQVINDARQNRPAIKCHPVGSGADRETAEILDGLIRNIEYTSNADVAYDTALENAVYGGMGYVLVRTNYASDDSFDLDLRIEPVFNVFTVFGDPYVGEADSANWNSAFVTDLIQRDEFKKRWPDSEVSDFDNKDEKDSLWFDGDRVQVAEWWVRDEVPGVLVKLSDGNIMREDAYLQIKETLDAQFPPVTVVGTRPIKTHRVQQHIVCGSEVLETNPWKGRYIPIIPVYGEMVNIEGKKYYQSLIHFAKDSQRQYNFWSTTSTEIMAMQPKVPFIAAEGMLDNDKNWETANSVNHPYLTYTPVPDAPPPQRQPAPQPSMGAINEALRASDDMKSIMGIHDASLGAQGNETSGRAILARQREGDVSTFNFIDNLSRAIRHVGRVCVDLIPSIYDGPRVLRCIKEDGTNFSMPVNQPVIPQQPQQPPAPPMAGGMPPPQEPQNGPQQPNYVPAPPHVMADPVMQAIAKVFDLTVGKYDVTVEAGPSFTTRREEAASQMMEFMRVLPNAAPLIGDLLAKNLDWPGSDEIAKRLQAMLPPAIQGQNPQVAQLQQQLQHQDSQAKDAVGQLQQQLTQMQLQLKDKSQSEQVAQYNAETARIVALADAVKNGVQLTQTAEGGVQAVPLMQDKAPTPDTVIDAQLRSRELDQNQGDIGLKERKLALEEQQHQLEVAKANFDMQQRAQEAQATHAATVDIPAQMLSQQQAHHEALLSGLAGMTQAIVQGMAKKPTRKRAVKQGDGSFVMTEEPDEQVTAS